MTVWYHGAFDKITYYNDIGLVKLQTPFVFNSAVKAIPIADSSESFENKVCTVSGWGKKLDGILNAT